MRCNRRLSNLLLVSALTLAFGRLAPAQSNQVVYADALQNGWENWSWAAVNFGATSPVHGGTKSISVTAAGWEALFLHNNTPLDPATATNLSFWIHGGATGGQLLVVQAILGGNAVASGTNLPA